MQFLVDQRIIYQGFPLPIHATHYVVCAGMTMRQRACRLGDSEVLGAAWIGPREAPSGRNSTVSLASLQKPETWLPPVNFHVNGSNQVTALYEARNGTIPSRQTYLFQRGSWTTRSARPRPAFGN